LKEKAKKIRKVIFLDVDGVLNSEAIAQEWHLRTGKNGWGGFFKENEKATDENVKWGREAVSNLKNLVDTTGAEIVISSTWRKHFSVEKFKEMFAIYGWENAPVIDKTPTSFRIRGLEVNSWLKDHPDVDKYVILDDFDDFMVQQRPYFVNTDPEVGLTSEDVQKAYNILNGIQPVP
jgi:hypothetical protein